MLPVRGPPGHREYSTSHDHRHESAAAADDDHRVAAQTGLATVKKLELLFRYRARNWPQALDAEERERWEAFRRARLTRATPLTTLTLDDYFVRLAELRNDPLAQGKLALLDQLQAWGEELATDL